MNREKNPFSPGAGSPPPELAGRDSVLDDAEVLIARVKARRSEKSMLLTGLRGVGKTVLLSEIERKARQAECQTIFIEAQEGKSLGEMLVPPLRQMLYDLNRAAGMHDTIRRGLAVLRGFIGTLKVSVGDVSFGVDIQPEQGTADSGDIANDLPALFSVVAEAAGVHQTALGLFIDEVQYFSKPELGALIMAMHKMQQGQLPLFLVGAGLPILPALAGETKTYAERLFSFPDISALSRADAEKALRGPMSSAGVVLQDDALESIYEKTCGYPYFIQEWGYQVWNLCAEGSPVSSQLVDEASNAVIPRLDQNFFRVRFNRLTPNERKVLRAIADLGTGPYRIRDIAESLRTKIYAISPIRESLIKKGMLYSPAHGDLAFTVPLFDTFMRRALPLEQQPEKTILPPDWNPRCSDG